jgi:hypothetical protein
MLVNDGHKLDFHGQKKCEKRGENKKRGREIKMKSFDETFKQNKK